MSGPRRHGNIALFVPHLGCPHQCSFCEQGTITGAGHRQPPTPEDVARAARIAAESGRGRETEIAFFGGSFTAIDRGYMLALLEAAKAAVERYGFKGVRCSTRPDAVDPQVLGLLKAYRVTAVELGAQSMDNGVLAANRRGHRAEDTVRAAGLVCKVGLELGLQMMTGLYTDTDEKALDTADKLIALGPRTMRVYPTLVLPGTELAALWQGGRYAPQPLEEAVALCARLLDRFEQAGVRVIRMGLHAGPGLEQARLAGPYHPAFRQLVESRRFLGRLLATLAGQGPGDYVVAVCPEDISNALGQGRENLGRLEGLGYRVRFLQQAGLGRGTYRATRIEEARQEK